ncbi:TetR family transcriptional regulator C-terminal domain-containing protein [Flavivirga aquimarina]|uniref:TetR family transcriptional regulator C-terminal domain-containing protein n=1 Tax=Flavivirga aquimarina TaxID=2027862 RepID=A0ABT8WE76_9FLAO|nr:TetR/AcrR family transcriptional regulator [Flavivirga aquimarina]MDO5971435.1 TetR family transcriptional regulator C-terminal domain-containing protein [Flavivirga aquimarina]
MKKDTVNNILARGAELVLKKGYNNVGIQEVLDAADIPKGSFYYYFKSKEDFGLQLIDYYSKNSSNNLDSYLKNSDLNHKERILTFFKNMRAYFGKKEFKEGCLLANCSLELSDQSEKLRNGIGLGWELWDKSFEICIAEGQESGVIKKDKSPESLASFVISGWEGAVLRMKSSKSSKPIDVYIEFLNEIIL